MTSEPIPFGVLPDGRPVALHRIASPGGLEAEVLDYGAVIRSLGVPTAAGSVEVVLGFDTLEAYLADKSYQGCIVGRVANRIGGARFGLDGRAFVLKPNEGANLLHGGAIGFSRRLWRVESLEAHAITLAYSSPDGEEGFPGTLQVRTRIAVSAADTVEIDWEATTDQPTPVNLTHHLYFNLSGDPTTPILDHTLAIAADAVTAVRPDLIPTGERLGVDCTSFDLRSPRRIGEALAQPDPQLTIGGGFDQNWILNPGSEPALTLSCPRSGLRMSVTTDQPGMQVYSGQGLTAPFTAHGGVVFEPQDLPDAVNQPTFPSVILRPGETYRRWARYTFEAAS